MDVNASVSVKIPKKVFQVWIGDPKNIPDTYKISLASIEKFMVQYGWEYKLLKDPEALEFVAREYPDFLDTYKNFEYDIQRADAIRPLWLKKHGGLYMDMDFELLDTIDRLFMSDADAYFLPNYNKTYKFGGLYTNAIMASKPGARVLDYYIAEMQKNKKKLTFGKHMKVINTTGPKALSKAIGKSGKVNATLPANILAPCSVCNVETCDHRHSLMRQLKGKSWNSFDSEIYNFFYCKYRYILAAILILIFFIFLWKFCHRQKN
jgi:mannosyltransferase OCH1-like enzyme